MAILRDFLSNHRYIQLNEIKYHALNNELPKKPKSVYFDDFNVECENNSIIITVTRHIKFEPECFFTADVSYSVTYSILNEKYEDFSKENFNYTDEVKSDLENYIPDEMDRISLIISQITDAFEGRPLITAPRLCFID